MAADACRRGPCPPSKGLSRALRRCGATGLRTEFGHRACAVSAGGWREQSAWGCPYLDVSRQVESLARQVGQLLAIGEPTWWMRDIRWGSVEVWGLRPTPFLVIGACSRARNSTRRVAGVCRHPTGELRPPTPDTTLNPTDLTLPGIGAIDFLRSQVGTQDRPDSSSRGRSKQFETRMLPVCHQKNHLRIDDSNLFIHFLIYQHSEQKQTPASTT
jgi:hypothetical protein